MKVIKILHLGLAVVEGVNPKSHKGNTSVSTFLLHVDEIPDDVWNNFVN